MSTRLRLTVVVAVAACGATLLSGVASAAPYLVEVADGSLSYSPKTAHVKKGKVVKWTNKGSGPHTVTFWKKPKKSGVKSFTLADGASKKRRMRKTGTYKYRCVIQAHSSVSDGKCSGMCGKVLVHK
jgi:plastocyanin